LEQRSQRRTKAAIPVHIRGKDAQGETFEETLEAQDVSRRGLSILTRRDLPVSTTLSIVIPGRGRFQPGQGPSDLLVDATVVRAEKAGDHNRVALRFVGATLATYSAETV
jgi:PilZ domain-containing protein